MTTQKNCQFKFQISSMQAELKFMMIVFLQIIYQINLIKLKYMQKYSRPQEKQIIGHFPFHEQVIIAARAQIQQQILSLSQRKVLILHTGGTIGMFRNQQGKFQPQQNRFQQFLKSFPYFCDQDQTYFNSKDGFYITPPSIYHKKIWYKFKEFEELIDSTNSTIEKINKILFELEKQYDNYDAFIILHGTDTMAYTSSALSFMIENLKKTVIVTGAQVPMGEVRNDSINNLLCSLTIAGHFVIPEVVVIFDNKILRGNRTTKTSSSHFNSFKSPNFFPLGTLNLRINIFWELIRESRNDQETKFIPLKQKVQIVKISPLSKFTIPQSKYIIIQSYGAGNIPTQGPYSEWLKKNATLQPQNRKIIVNISQVYRSVILNIYATGNQAIKLGLIPGGDMTCEAAVTKLSYLASKGYSDKQIETLMQTNLRQQMTQQKDRFASSKTNYIMRCLALLSRKFQSQPKKYQKIAQTVLYPLLVCQRLSQTTLEKLMKFNFDPTFIYPDGGNILHYFAKMKSVVDIDHCFLKFLLQLNVDTTLLDKQGNSAAIYFAERGHFNEISMIMDKGGVVKTTTKRIFEAIRNEQLGFLNILARTGDKFEYLNVQKRNCAMYAVILQLRDAINFLIDATNLFQEVNKNHKDIYGNTLSFYMEKKKIFIEDPQNEQH